jgi:hypothetical protein
MLKTIRREWHKRRSGIFIPDLGERHIVCDWVREGEGPAAPMVDMVRYGKLLELLPDRIVTNLERARLAQDGRIPMLKAGLGYEELLASTIVDGSAIASSSTEAFLVPALLLPRNYLQPGGIPGRTLRLKGTGRVTTLTTAATMIFKIGSALTNVIPTTTWAVSGGITQDTVVQTASQWQTECAVTVRSVGSAGTVFAQGQCDMATAALTIANLTAKFMGSAGALAPAAVVVDMTADLFFGFTGKWSLSTAYSIQCHRFMLEALN